MSMFSKAGQDAGPAPSLRPLPSDPAPGPPLPGARPLGPASATSTPSSVLGPELNIRGGIEGRGEIQLQGRAWGDVKVERLVVSETAELEGSIIANVVEVRGRVKGSIEAHSVRLLASARVEGDITYESLQIEAGAHFEGRCTRATPTAPKEGATTKAPAAA